ncbi:thiamine phosphate synthase [Agaribacterium haliotis]|uniref:thiamine phosphate synthase n=1 Tax=Agaribacterium haliotis TaxID=2013869 RepID=UPI000BB539A9|nr:thiamine phosphate synthase [Agaribacterium haliotis]
MSNSTNASRPAVLCIGGNDSAGMAGLSMDVKVCSALGAHALSVCTANTAQNSTQFSALNPLACETLQSQLDGIQSCEFSTIKLGLVASEEQLDLLKHWLPKQQRPVIWDPVMAATAGDSFCSASMLAKLKELAHGISLLTPNIPEAEALLEQSITSPGDIEAAAKQLLQLGFQAVLIKGGHRDSIQGQNQSLAQDYFSDGQRSFWLSSEALPGSNTRGSGCAFASAVAAALALQYSLYDAVVIAKMAINQGMLNSYALGAQRGPLAVKNFPKSQHELPVLSATHPDELLPAFPGCTLPDGGEAPLGLYPVVDSAAWLERLLPLGITTAQLRVKELEGKALEDEIERAISLGRQYNCRLFINDYWQLAIKHQAYGVHLGQEDLDDADIKAIREAGLRLGTSTHCHYEVARAHHYRPSYVAVGPVYATTTKIMPWIPHGPEGFRYWQQCLNYPLVAIGGINASRIQAMLEAGANGIAMITAITLAESPQNSAKIFKEQIDEYQQQSAK